MNHTKSQQYFSSSGLRENNGAKELNGCNNQTGGSSLGTESDETNWNRQFYLNLLNIPKIVPQVPELTSKNKQPVMCNTVRLPPMLSDVRYFLFS